MISRFSGSNYKAFKEFDIEFKPITILLGANSSGKSALINSLLMLSQSADSTAISESALRLNGNKTGMGETLNIVRDKNPENKLSFTFSLSTTDILKKNLHSAKSGCLEMHTQIIRFISYIVRQGPAKPEILSKLMSKVEELQLSTSDNMASPQKIKEFSSLYIKIIKIYRANLPTERKARIFTPEFIAATEKTSIRKIEDCFDTLMSASASRITPTRISYSFSYNKKQENLKVSEYIQYNKAGAVVFGFKREGQNTKIFSDVFSQVALDRSKTEILKTIDFDSMKISRASPQLSVSFGSFTFIKNSPNPFASILAHFVAITSKHLLDSLTDLQINHVSPLRAFPQRYYLLDKSIHHRKLNALDGTELAEVLKNNPEIKNKINVLFAPFNIGIDIERVNDIIHKIVVNQDSVNLELTDVGFGISQVLPILVQAYLSPKDSLTIIEQPEIHLHPNMQAWLTDALIVIALKESKKFLIETHSDALIRRIRLRVVDDSSALSEEDIKIYYLHRDRAGSCTTLDNIAINATGDIKWPRDFMDVEIKDTIQIQQLKSEKSSKTEGVLHG